jgi:3-oxoacyl-[acyl-carrier protein] reductase
MRLAQKKALVTGGGAGLGLAMARALAAEGAQVAVWECNPDLLTALSEEFPLVGQVDVSQPDQVRRAAAKLLERWGRLDILINNAGICLTGSIDQISEQDWDRVLAVNLKGTFLCSQAFAETMRKQGAGKIINLGSIAGKLGGIAAGAHYSASKAGVMCFTKSLARELAPYGVNVNALAPGVIVTDMTRALSGGDFTEYEAGIPLGRVGEPKELAAVAVFLASEDSNYLTGEIIDVNGGQLMD